MAIKPQDLYTTNHFYIDMVGLVSPHFHTVEGIEQKSGEVSIVDGTTNIKHKFSSQLKEYSDITLTRAMDGTIDDTTLKALVQQCMNNGFRFDANLVKMHNGQEVFRILMLGVRIKNYTYPTFNTEAEERLDMKYVLSVSEWVEL